MTDKLKELQDLFQSIDNHELALRRKKILANVQRMVLLRGHTLDESIAETKGMLKAFGVQPETTPKQLQHHRVSEKTRRRRHDARTQERQTVKLDMPIEQKFYPSWMTEKMTKNTRKFEKHRRELVERLEKCKAALKSLDVMPEQDIEDMKERNFVRMRYLGVLRDQVSEHYHRALEDIENQASDSLALW